MGGAQPGWRIYLAGPMSGLPEYNFPAFFLAEEQLTRMGHRVVNPAAHDLEVYPDMKQWPEYATGAPGKAFSLAKALHWDLHQVLACDAIALLPGWEKSKGANLELSVAQNTGKLVFLYKDGQLVDMPKTPTEVRVTDPKTGGQKGVKEDRYDLIPPEFEDALARHYGRGAQKYDDNNWLKGYNWGYSLRALRSHLNAWQRGESTDQETGSSHLVCAAWHCIALFTFELRGLGTDNVRRK